MDFEQILIIPYKNSFIKEILSHQEELYSQNFKELSFDVPFFLGIADWYDKTLHSNDSFANVLIIENKIQGFYLYNLEKVNEQKSSYLAQMFISSELRHKGYGSALLRHFEEESYQFGAKEFKLHVSTINSTATNFYLKHNYRIIGEEFDINDDVRLFMSKEKRGIN